MPMDGASDPSVLFCIIQSLESPYSKNVVIIVGGFLPACLYPVRTLWVDQSGAMSDPRTFRLPVVRIQNLARNGTYRLDILFEAHIFQYFIAH